MDSKEIEIEESLTIERVAKEANLKVSRVRTAIARGELAHLKIGALIRIRRSALRAWLDACTVPAKAVK